MIFGEPIKGRSQTARLSLALQSFGHGIRQACDGGRGFGEPIDRQVSSFKCPLHFTCFVHQKEQQSKNCWQSCLQKTEAYLSFAEVKNL